MICRHKLYHFTVANTRFKTEFATVKWYNLCLQIIQSQTCYPLINVTTQSATFSATSEDYRDVKENNIGIFLFKRHISRRYEKNNQVPMLNQDRQILVLGDTMSHPSLGYRLDWYLRHLITLDWALSVWIQHWYLILLKSFSALFEPLRWLWLSRSL